MKTIPLANHPWYALVDDEDYELVAGDVWHALPGGYAYRTGRLSDGVASVYMHRLIMAAPAGLDVDHINHRKLDNRRANLRIATRTQNRQNERKRAMRAGRPIRSAYKGVVFHTKSRMYQARISVNGTCLSLRYHRTERDAALAYDRAAREHFGEFAVLNFPAVQPPNPQPGR